MKPIRFSLYLFGLEKLFGGDIRRVIEFVHEADEAGLDQVVVSDHVVMGEHSDRYPYGPFPVAPDYPWFEPITTLAAMASVTKRMRLAIGILITPLRPAVLLAKQAATLDVIAGGRLDLGIGTGWQEEEYTSSGIPFKGRKARMIDQVRAMRELWQNAPASFASPTVSFERVYSRPAPAGKSIPLHFGIAPTDDNIALMAELADGWLPMLRAPSEYGPFAQRIFEKLPEFGRTPDDFTVRAQVRPMKDAAGKVSIDASLASIPEMIAAGVTEFTLTPLSFVNDVAGLRQLVARVVREAQSYR
jgi:probable F420-dependent oxidoreductase